MISRRRPARRLLPSSWRTTRRCRSSGTRPNSRVVAATSTEVPVSSPRRVSTEIAASQAEVAARIADVFNAGVSAGAHVIYLGHCGEPDGNAHGDVDLDADGDAYREAPGTGGFLCTHAYAINAAGASWMLRRSRACADAAWQCKAESRRHRGPRASVARRPRRVQATSTTTTSPRRWQSTGRWRPRAAGPSVSASPTRGPT